MLCMGTPFHQLLGGFHGGFRTGRTGDSSPPHHFNHAAKRSERRVNRFDDQSGQLRSGLPNRLPRYQAVLLDIQVKTLHLGLLHKTDGTLSREHRRQLFMLKAKTEEDERKTRALLFEQHYNKCAYLR